MPPRVRRLLAVNRTEWTHLFRDSRSLGVIVAQPLVLLILYGYAINFDLKHLAVAVYDRDRSAASRALLRDLDSSTYFEITHSLDGHSQVAPLLDRGAVRLVLVIPTDFGKDLSRGRAADLQLLLDGADSNTATIARAYTEGLLALHAQRLLRSYARRHGARLSLPAILPETRFLYNESLESTQFIVPGLIAIVLAMLSALLTAGTVVRERENGTIEQLLASPLRPHELLAGKLAPYVTLSMFNTALVILAGRLLFGIWPAGSLWLLLALVLLVLPTMLGIGLLFSIVVSTQQLALVAAFLATVLPSILLSGFVFPIQNMPRPLQVLSNLVPATHLLKILRGIYLKGVGLSVLWPQALILLLFAVVVMRLCVAKFSEYLD
jgi:ABC-2 type transport system permease protein